MLVFAAAFSALCLLASTQAIPFSMNMSVAQYLEPLADISTGAKISKRSTCGTPSLLTSGERTQSLDAHNDFRAMETNAADMSQMVYSDELAARAQEWADGCVWAHGLTSMCDGTSIGQNMYISMSSGGFPDSDMTKAVKSWYDEKVDYDYNSNTCAANKVCGHYTQVVWAKSTEVGCAVARCPSMNVGGRIWNSATFVVCNYAPAGNFNGELPYVSGSSCSQCTNALGTNVGNKCVDGMCVACFPGEDSACSCPPASSCSGQGSYNTNTCGCDCNSGFYGDECQSSCNCADAPGYESSCPQWTVYCTNPSYRTFMTDYCRGTCTNLCQHPAGAC